MRSQRVLFLFTVHLKKMVSMDEGAAYLGECALVPYSSPIRQSGVLFYNTLYDENAACHLAIGMGFTNVLRDFEKYTEDEAQFAILNGFAAELPTMFITSQATVVKTAAPEGAFTETVSGIAVVVEPADGEKCDRCWMYTTAPIYDGEGEDRGCLCGRCHKVVFGE